MDDTRPTPLIDDIDGTRKKLESWISSNRCQKVRISDLSIPEATGMSNVTLLFDITWQEKGQTNSESVVARLQPSIERPVFPDYDMTLQYEVMDVVGRNSDIPAARVAISQRNPVRQIRRLHEGRKVFASNFSSL